MGAVPPLPRRSSCDAAGAALSGALGHLYVTSGRLATADVGFLAGAYSLPLSIGSSAGSLTARGPARWWPL